MVGYEQWMYYFHYYIPEWLQFTLFAELNEKLATRVFDDFAGPANWEVFPDVEPSLKKIKQAGVVLGVISNFDERLG